MPKSNIKTRVKALPKAQNLLKSEKKKILSQANGHRGYLVMLSAAEMEEIAGALDSIRRGASYTNSNPETFLRCVAAFSLAYQRNRGAS